MHLSSIVFTPRCYASAVYAIVMFLSVCMSHSCVFNLPHQHLVPL